MSLKKKTISGIVWSGFAQGSKQLSQFVITVILVRLLSPSDFGLLAMSIAFIEFASIFGEMGISNALIQKQDIEDMHYNSAFWLNICMGIILMILMMLLSPLVAKFYNKPELKLIIIVISSNFVLASLSIVQQAILTKEMQFRKLAIRDILAIIFSGLIGVYLAYMKFGVWSLVFQLLSFSLINIVLLWTLSKWKPKFNFSISHLKDLFNFGANLTGFNIVNYFARNTDKLLIGKFLGAQALGFYSLAYKLMLYPLQNISWVISNVMFPAFSKVQNDLEKVRLSYLKVVKAISLITFPLMLGLFAVAPEFVRFIYGNKWEPAIILIRILCFCGMVQSVNTTVGDIILSQGKSDLLLKLGILGAAFLSLNIIIGLKWGTFGVVIFYTCAYFFWSIFVQKITNRLISLKFKQFLKALTNSFLISLIILAFILALKQIVKINNIAIFFAYIFSIAILYLSLLFAFKEVRFNYGKILVVSLE